MIRIFTLSICCLFIVQLGTSQIKHIDYGEGLTIPMGSNYEMDINSDGTTDFYINSHTTGLGFTPIQLYGCFTSRFEGDTTTWGDMKLSIHEKGDLIKMTDTNMWDYIEYGIAGIYNNEAGLATGWTHNEPQFIGFGTFVGQSNVINGWMSLKVDVENKTIVLLEYAYQAAQPMNFGGIAVGSRGLTAVNDLNDVLYQVSVSPNPASDYLNVEFKYVGKDDMRIIVLDNTGRQILNRRGNNETQFTFDTSNWTEGLYLINFETAVGSQTEKVFVRR